MQSILECLQSTSKTLSFLHFCGKLGPRTMSYWLARVILILDGEPKAACNEPSIIVNWKPSQVKLGSVLLNCRSMKLIWAHRTVAIARTYDHLQLWDENLLHLLKFVALSTYTGLSCTWQCRNASLCTYIWSNTLYSFRDTVKRGRDHIMTSWFSTFISLLQEYHLYYTETFQTN